MTTTNNMNTTPAAAAIENTATAEKAAPAVWPVRYERMTFGEYLDAIAAGEIAEPVFQRGAVWTEKQNARLLACLLAGRVMPAIIVATVPMNDGERLGLLVDGKQRTTALTTALEAAEAEEDDTRAEAIKAIAVDILYTDTPSLTAAAEFFVDLNSGAKLSAIQRNKAALSDSCMAFVNSFQNELTRARPGEKWGKVNADTAAAMLAAAVVDGVNVATSSAGASKILAGVKEAPAFPALRLAQLLRAIQLLEAGDAQTVADYNAAKAAALAAVGEDSALVDVSAPINYGNKGGKEAVYWCSPAHLVPVWVWACRREDVDADALAEVMKAFNPTAKARFSFTQNKGKTSKRVSKSLADAWGDTSNSKAATYARTAGFAAFAKSYLEMKDAPELAADDMEQTAERAQDVADTAAALAQALA